jgi:hypothetical protein
MCSHFLERLTLVGVTIGMGFCVSGSYVRCNVASRQYLNLSSKIGIMEDCEIGVCIGL